MISRRDSSKRGIATPLVEMFADRAGTTGLSARQVMENLVERLRKECASASALSLERYFPARNIFEKRIDPVITCDGYIEPIGEEFAQGFRLVLNGNGPSTRQRFTIAHEICHTFFYELVPDLKFRPHQTDACEEALCNQGAAALLMPGEDVVAQAKPRDVSLATLEDLARRYEVSLETAFLRLRDLRLWDCEMSVWHRMVSGEFVVDRIHGWLKADWRWADSSVPARAWLGKSPITGHSFVYCEASNGYSTAKPVYYQIKRRGESLVALWGRRRLGHAKRKWTLFEEGSGKSPLRRGQPPR